MLQSITLGLVDSINPCALFILLFLVGFLFLTALRKNIIKNAVSFIVALFVVLFVFYGVLISSNLISLGVVGLIGKILTLFLGVYGIIYFFSYKKEIFAKLNKFIFSFPIAILFAILLPFLLLPCAAGAAMIAIKTGSLFLYLLGFIVPLILISLIVYALGSKSEETINKIRFLRLVGSIILILIVFVL